MEVDSSERYRHIVENAEDMIYSLSPDGHFTFVNSAAAAIVRRSVDECLGLHFLSLVREDFHETAIDFYQQQIQDRIPATYFEFPVVARDGAEIWIGQSLQLAMEDGEIVELQALGRNIKRAGRKPRDCSCNRSAATACSLKATRIPCGSLTRRRRPFSP